MSTIIENKDDNTHRVRKTDGSATGTTTTGGRNYTTKNNRLKFLDDLSGYKVHHDDIDPRGYSVKLASGETIGEVEGLLADTSANLVRYVEIEIDDDVIERYSGNHYDADDKHALVPVGVVHINAASNSVQLLGVGLDQMVDYPRFRKDRGYTTGYEVDTNDYLANFHEYGNTYDRDTYSTDTYRNANTLDDKFYDNSFYTHTKRT